MSKTYKQKGKQLKTNEDPEDDSDVNKDVNVACFSNTCYKVGLKNNMDWIQMHKILQHKEYLVYVLEYSSLDSRLDRQKYDCEAYTHFHQYWIDHNARQPIIFPYYDMVKVGNWSSRGTKDSSRRRDVGQTNTGNTR